MTSEDLIRLRQDLNALSLLDSIAYRFSKLQKTLGKILRLYLAYQGEDVEELFMRDVINLAEKRGLPINWSKWVKLRILRNILIHEYEDDSQLIAETLNQIQSLLEDLKSLIEKLMKEL